MVPEWSSDRLDQAAVDDDVGAGHVARSSAGEQDDEVGDFVGSAETSGGGVGGEALDDGLGVEVLTCADRAGVAVFAEPQPGLDGAGADGVDADAVWSDFFGERLAEVGERGFGSAVVDDSRVWEE